MNKNLPRLSFHVSGHCVRSLGSLSEYTWVQLELFLRVDLHFNPLVWIRAKVIGAFFQFGFKLYEPNNVCKLKISLKKSFSHLLLIWWIKEINLSLPSGVKFRAALRNQRLIKDQIIIQISVLMCLLSVSRAWYPVSECEENHTEEENTPPGLKATSSESILKYSTGSVRITFKLLFCLNFLLKNVFNYSWYLWRTVRKRDPWSCHLRGNGWEGMKRGTAVGWVWSFLHVSVKTAQCLCNIYYSRDRKNKHQAKVRILRLQRQTPAFLMICR